MHRARVRGCELRSGAGESVPCWGARAYTPAIRAGLALSRELLDVGDVVPRVPVQRLLEAELVEVVADEADGAPEDEEPVQRPEGHELVALLAGESAAGADHVHEGHRDAAVHVQDEVRALASGELLHREGKVEDRGGLEVLLRELLDDDDALVRVRQGLHPVADAHDELVGLLHLVDELLGADAAVVRLGEHLRGVVQGTAEPRPDGEQPAAERRHEVLPRPGADDGVVGAADGGPVVRRDHQDHLDELRASRGELPAEPEQRDHAADAQIPVEDIRDRDAAVLELLTTIVGDGGDEVRGLADHA
mmetsp:Transcript_89830/g.249790  ORF Transcript_89830/g.249790 Transcript_89830/m.249790 type:complete len:306 (-) Transcript_89830:296-1213(-)